MRDTRARDFAPFLICLLVYSCDQLAKHWASLALTGDPQPNPSVFDGRLSLLYTENRGAAFGVLAGSGALFVAVAAIVVAAMVASIVMFPGRRLATLCSLGLQMGGAAGNMTDRLQHGYVVDFVYLRPLPVFNLADLAIVSGACLLAWVWLVPSAGHPNELKAAKG